MFYSQSNELEYSVDRVSKADSGWYVCRASNDFGTEEAEVFVKILSAPLVTVVPSEVATVEGLSVLLKCVVENQDDKVHKIKWRHGKIEVNGQVRGLPAGFKKLKSNPKIFRKTRRLLRSLQTETSTTLQSLARWNLTMVS